MSWKMVSFNYMVLGCRFLAWAYCNGEYHLTIDDSTRNLVPGGIIKCDPRGHYRDEAVTLQGEEILDGLLEKGLKSHGVYLAGYKEYQSSDE